MQTKAIGICAVCEQVFEYNIKYPKTSFCSNKCINEYNALKRRLHDIEQVRHMELVMRGHMTNKLLTLPQCKQKKS